MSMIVTCSNCQTKFLVDEQLLLPHGRDVACNRCHNQWFEPKPTHLAQRQPTQSNQIPSESPPSAEPDPRVQQANQVQSQAPREQTQSQQASARPTGEKQPPIAGPQAEMTRQDITQRLAHIRESVQSQSTTHHPVQPNASQHGDTWDGAPQQQNIPPFVTTPPHGGGAPSVQHPSDQSSSAQQGEASFTHSNSMVPVNPKHSQNTRSWGGQMLILLFVALLLAGVIAWVTKDKIISTFPQLQPYYQMLGIETQAMNKALIILEPTAKIETEDGKSILMISGVIENRQNQTKPVPLLMAQVKDGQGGVLNQWTFKATTETIAPRSTVTYTTSIANPSERANQVAVIIAPQEKP